jgi:hypothetical protein
MFISLPTSGKEVINLHPQESSDVGNLKGRSRQCSVGHLSSSRNDLGRVELVGVDGAGREGVAREGNGSGTCCGSGASSDGTVLSGRRERESAGDGRNQDGGEKTLHVNDWVERKFWWCRCKKPWGGDRASYIDSNNHGR